MTCVAITGATGFIGRRFLTHLDGRNLRLRLHARHPLQLLDATRGAAAAAQVAGIEPPVVVGGDLHARSTWHELLDGADLAVHLAGAVRGRNPRDFAVNTGAVVALRDAALAEPRLRIVLVSSLAARQPQLSAYAESKRAGERLLQAEPGLDWTILRPPAVYGPGDRELAPLLNLWAKGFGVCPGDRAARMSLLHVDDLCGALLATLRAPGARGHVLEPDDGKAGGYAWREVMEVVSNITGQPIRPLRLPRAVLELAGHLVVIASAVRGDAPMLTPGKVRELTHRDWVSQGDVARRLLGWQPAIDLRAGLTPLLLP